jgi:hypothetical protein
MLKQSFLMRAVACVAVIAVASVAGAQVQFGVVGAGQYHEWGGGVGIGSESYDWYVDGGQWDTYIKPMTTEIPFGGTLPAGTNEGVVLLALNPYTGELWTDVDQTHQACDPNSSYNGHAQSTYLPGGEYITNHTPSATGYTENVIMFTSEHRWDGGGGLFGMFVQGSSDVNFLAEGGEGNWAGLDERYEKSMSVGDVIDANSGEWASASTNGFIGHVGAHNWMWYTGTAYSTGTLAFEMDGIYGWIRYVKAGERSGVRLLDYYFDFVGGGDPLDIDGDGDVDADDIDMLFTMVGGTDMTGDLDGDLDVDQDDVDFWVGNVPIGENTGTVYGDFNLDGAVDAGDLALLGGSFGLAGPFGWANGDATGDGVVDAGDLALLGGNFGTIVHPVPEPVTMSLLAIGGAALLRRRK